MKIANPIYDLAFKYMMENERIARLVLSTILEQEVVNVRLGTQELVIPKLKQEKETDNEEYKTNPFAVYRLDFRAEILNKDGKRETVLIEIQKASSGTEIKRFRTYLGKNYQKGVEEQNEKGEKTIVYYPIVTIYILGYNLPDLPYLGIAVERRIIDMSSGVQVEKECSFIDKLNHRSYILQIQNLPPERKTRLEKFMTLFNQAWIAENDYILDLEEVPDEFREIAEYLQAALADEELRANLEGEEEMKNYSNRLKLAETREKEAKAKVEEERKQKEEAINTLKRTIQNLLSQGMDLGQIAKILGKTINEIKGLIEQ